MKDKFFDESFEQNIQKAEEKFKNVLELNEVSSEFKNNWKKERKVDKETMRQLEEIDRSVEKAEKKIDKFLDVISGENSSQEK